MTGPPVVLLVEDNTELRHVLKEAFSSEGYRVLSARNDGEALEILRSNAVDLFVSDLTDPPVASQSLRQVENEFPGLPIVALDEAGTHPAFFFSAWEGPQRMVRTLPKPFRLRELLAVSRDILGPARRS